MAQKEEETLLTVEGLKMLEKELDHLKTVKRKEVAERIKQAMDFGDISENSEYEDAKNEQAFIEGRILTLEKKLRNAKVIDGEDVDTDVVSICTKVKMEVIDSGEIVEYVIVGSIETDPSENKISNESPVGKAIIGHRVGDIVEVETPEGKVKYKILEISR